MAAGDAVIKGTNGFTEQPERQRWIRTRGWQRVRSWQGPRSDALLATLIAQIQALNAEEIDVQEGHPTIVSAFMPADTDTSGVIVVDTDAVTEWTLEPYDLEKSLGTHGIFNVSGSSAEVLAKIDAELNAGDGYGKNYETLYAGLGEFNEYAKLKGQGVESWLTWGYVLRAVLTCERDNEYVRQYQAVTDNRGKVISWINIGVPQSAKIEQPWIHIYAPADAAGWTFKTGAAGGWADVYFNDWLVRPPAIRFVKEGRIKKRQLVREYIGAFAWSGTLYDGGHGTP